MRSHRRLKLLVAYLIAAITMAIIGDGIVAKVLFILPTIFGLLSWFAGKDPRETREVRNLLLASPIVLIVYIYPSLIALKTVETPKEEEARVFGHMHGRGIAGKFELRDGKFVDNETGLRFEASLPPGVINMLTAKAMEARKSELARRGEEDKFGKWGYEWSFRLGLREGFRKKFETPPLGER